MVGRKPVPTALKLLRGNPGHRRINLAEPAPQPAILACPEHLGPIAKAEWARLAPLLHNLRLLTELDRAALASICECWERSVKASEAITKYGLVMRKGDVVSASPFIRIANQNLEQMRKLLTEFGMTPSSRSRIAAAPKQEPEEDTRFFAS